MGFPGARSQDVGVYRRYVEVFGTWYLDDSRMSGLVSLF
jgi:hypothetical protein